MDMHTKQCQICGIEYHKQEITEYNQRPICIGCNQTVEEENFTDEIRKMPDEPDVKPKRPVKITPNINLKEKVKD